MNDTALYIQITHFIMGTRKCGERKNKYQMKMFINTSYILVALKPVENTT